MIGDSFAQVCVCSNAIQTEQKLNKPQAKPPPLFQQPFGQNKPLNHQISHEDILPSPTAVPASLLLLLALSLFLQFSGCMLSYRVNSLNKGLFLITH